MIETNPSNSIVSVAFAFLRAFALQGYAICIRELIP
jgi:hypothetical protein